MERKKRHIDLILQRPGKFLWRVLIGFKRNQGLLLAGADKTETETLQSE